jgi:hypothetical protein
VRKRPLNLFSFPAFTPMARLTPAVTGTATATPAPPAVHGIHLPALFYNADGP